MNREAIVIAGKTKPTEGTKIEGKYEAVMIEYPRIKLWKIKMNNLYYILREKELNKNYMLF
jgi:hypothetical protein